LTRGPLTQREREVAILVAQARSNQEIAEALVIAVSTVERHVANILGKLGMRSRTDVALWLVQTNNDVQRATAPLKAQLTTLIGRDHDVAEVVRLLQRQRLVTLSGVGGVGKTRLALAAADALNPAMIPDGVSVIELAPTVDASLVPSALALALRIPEQPGQTPTEVVVEALRKQRLLLLLDNCEHVLDGCVDLVSQLLGDCQGLRILATSREALGINGEVVWPVSPLATPARAPDETARSILAAPAVQLFTARATAIRPDFAVSDENAPVVAAICRQLEGIPLATELAAAWLNVLSVQQVQIRLADRFHLLVAGDTSAPDRHRTLRASLDWSFELLSASERRLLERMAVFRGGWTLEAAELIGSDDDIAASDLLVLLRQLVKKSLVLAHSAPGGKSMRFSVLEMVRQYAQEQLETRGRSEFEAIRRRHAVMFLTFAESAEAKLSSASRGSWLERLEIEHDNLRAALRWAADNSETELVLRMVAALWAFWGARPHVSEGRAWIERALTIPSAEKLFGLRARLLTAASLFAYGQGDIQTAAAFVADASQLEFELKDKPRHRAGLLYMRGRVAHKQGDLRMAVSYLENSLSLSEVVRDNSQLAATLQALAECHLAAGELESASDCASRALTLARHIGYQSASGLALQTLGTISHLTGDLARAREHFLASAFELQEGPELPYALLNLSHVAIEQRDFATARTSLLESLAAWQRLGNRVTVSRILEACAHLSAVEERPADAMQFAGAAERVRLQAGRPWSRSERATLERWLAPAREVLGTDDGTHFWKFGQEMAFDAAVETAWTTLGGSAATGQAARAAVGQFRYG
jgi:non-specific serine/threonine protein kinase